MRRAGLCAIRRSQGAPDTVNKADFEAALGHNVAYDAAGNLAYLATSGVNLRLTQERWPKLKFHATREHSAKLV